MPEGAAPKSPAEVIVKNKPTEPVSVTNVQEHSKLKVDAHITNSPDVVIANHPNVSRQAQGWQYKIIPAAPPGTLADRLNKEGKDEYEAVGFTFEGGVLLKKPL